jgi:hypothetical protein
MVIGDGSPSDCSSSVSGLPEFSRAIVILPAPSDRLADLKLVGSEGLVVWALVAKRQAIVIGA